jgi:outer membrane protein assembly factor BamB
MKRVLLFFASSLLLISLYAQKTPENFQFALVTDTHIGNETSAIDLRQTIIDINKNDSLSFVIFSGDVTEFGTDQELLLARQILDSLNKPWYIIPGNHDTKWSESGGNSFRKVFGSETFSFIFHDFLFIGTNSGPNMRMGPGQIPVENIVWLDSVLLVNKEKNLPIIYVNHYPPTEDINNWYEVIDRLKTGNIQLTLCGHGHSNKPLVSEGIPGLMGRSNLRGQNMTGGYNIMRVYRDTLLTASVRKPGKITLPAWASVRLFDHHFSDSTNHYQRPDFSMNGKFHFVKEVWRIKEKNDIGAGTAISGNKLITTNTGGSVNAYNSKTGRLLWQYRTGAKIYSTPVISGNIVIEAATNGILYALDLSSGKILWKFDTGQPTVASPVIFENQVFIAGSWGKCYSVSLRDGKLIWSNDKIKGFVETIPQVYRGKILFGTWGNHFYALNSLNGEIKWDWQNESTNRMLSPAACVPVVLHNRVFFVSPDRKMRCLDAETGHVIWLSDLDGKSVRESMGVSNDSTLIYAKTMNGEVIGVSTSAEEGKIVWNATINTGYDIAPSAITEKNGVIFVPTDEGVIYAVEKKSGRLIWEHRISSCLINQILPLNGNDVICTSMDGVITRLSY